MSWPHRIPAGLRNRLEAVLSQRSHGAAEIWGALQEWLEAEGVEKPEHVVPEATEGTAQRDQ